MMMMICLFLTVHLYTQRKEEKTKKVINITDLEVTEKKEFTSYTNYQARANLSNTKIKDILRQTTDHGESGSSGSHFS